MSEEIELIHWMFDYLFYHKNLSRKLVISHIIETYGDNSNLIYLNKRGNHAIRRKVIRLFSQYKCDDIRWNDKMRIWYITN